MNFKKQKYNKPKLRIIELVAEEVLSIGCKTITGLSAGPINGCRPIQGGPCHNRGS